MSLFLHTSAALTYSFIPIFNRGICSYIIHIGYNILFLKKVVIFFFLSVDSIF